LPDTAGVRIHAALAPREGERVIVKHAPNSFFETGLDAAIAEARVTELTVCGMMTHMCVDTTTRAAKDRAIPITLLHDACATKDLTFGGETVPAALVQAAYMAALSGMFAKVIAARELSL
jgi:nicotinamidase-related amidase